MLSALRLGHFSDQGMCMPHFSASRPHQESLSSVSADPTKKDREEKHNNLSDNVDTRHYKSPSGTLMHSVSCTDMHLRASNKLHRSVVFLSCKQCPDMPSNTRTRNVHNNENNDQRNQKDDIDIDSKVPASPPDCS